MSNPWASDDALYDGASHVAHKFVELMIAKNPFEPDEAYSWLSGNLHKFHRNAEHFMTLDPARITDEYERMQSVARDVGYDTSEEIMGGVDQIEQDLSDWLGDAADAFRRQLVNIKVFTNVQGEFVARTLGALAASLALAAHARRDYLELVRATVEGIDKAIADASEQATVFLIKVGGGIAKTVIGTLADPAKAMSTLAQGAIDIVVEGVSHSINGVEVDDILRSFADQERRMREAYDDELDMISHSLKQAGDALAEETFDLYEPLPSSTDVDSPDFRYERFYTKDQLPEGRFNQQVEDERKKMLAEEQGPDSGPHNLIQRRLEPDKEHS